jgi:hypothetical protein
MKELELKSLQIDSPQSLQELCTGLRDLRVLKLFGTLQLGIDTAAILREISTPSDRTVVAGCQNLEILQLCISGGVSVVKESTRDVVFRSPYLKRLWLGGCNDIEKLELDTPSIERLSIIDCGSLAHLGFDDEANLNPVRHIVHFLYYCYFLF